MLILAFIIAISPIDTRLLKEFKMKGFHVGRVDVSPRIPPVEAQFSRDLGGVRMLDTLYYDSGYPDDAWAWFRPGDGWGVKYVTPAPSRLVGILAYFWDETWPTPGGNNATFRVYEDQGGTPGQLLLEISNVEIDRGSWNFIDLSDYNIVVDSSFFIFYIQTDYFPYCPGLAIDERNNAPSGSQWALYGGNFYNDDARKGDWLLRAVVDWIPYSKDVAIKDIVEPRYPYLVPDSLYIPAFILVNYGSTFVNVGVEATIDEIGYSEEITIENIASGEERLIELNGFYPPYDSTDMTLSIWVYLEGDERPGNNHAIKVFRNYHILGDTLESYDVESITGDFQLLGVHSDGDFLYLTGGNSGEDPNKIYVIHEGQVIAVLDQPDPCSEWGIRDLAFDWTLTGFPADTFYAPCGSVLLNFRVGDELEIFRVDTLDFLNDGALALDEENRLFYTTEPGGPIYEFDTLGNILRELNNPYTAFGLAHWENSLWISAQEMSQFAYLNKLYRLSLDDGQIEDSIDFGLPDYENDGYAGGIAFVKNYQGYEALVELVQGDPTDFVVFIYLDRAEGLCGDVNSDNTVSSDDFIFLGNYLYFGGPPPQLPWIADVNGDGSVNSDDFIYLGNYLFYGGPSLNCSGR